jgi:hypothetical protein
MNPWECPCCWRPHAIGWLNRALETAEAVGQSPRKLIAAVRSHLESGDDMLAYAICQEWQDQLARVDAIVCLGESPSPEAVAAVRQQWFSDRLALLVNPRSRAAFTAAVLWAVTEASNAS